MTLDAGTIAGWCVIALAARMAIGGRLEAAVPFWFGGLTLLELTSQFVGRSLGGVRNNAVLEPRTETKVAESG